MNILCLYNSTQTYTNTVFDHLAGFSNFSEHSFFYAHVGPGAIGSIDLSRFSAICVHFSVRLPYDQLPECWVNALFEFKGLKFLFIQDEYDYTHRAWYWIKRVNFNLVFTVVPKNNIDFVYPAEKFENIRFVSNLTGYVPVEMASAEGYTPPSKRPIFIGYRGRSLPLRYGQLGFEKVAIGKLVKSYCDSHGLATDISWSEDDRIYGDAWPKFVGSCRAMLGSESGSNVFDWDGDLADQISTHQRQNTHASDEAIYEKVVKPLEQPDIMNQISPRVFEAIAHRTALVLFEGNYSGVIEPNLHFIPLSKDGSNMSEVVAKLQDASYVDSLVERAYDHVIGSGKFSYLAFVQMVDREIKDALSRLHCESKVLPKIIFRPSEVPAFITTSPLRAVIDNSLKVSTVSFPSKGIVSISLPLGRVWALLPVQLRSMLRPLLRKVWRFMKPRLG